MQEQLKFIILLQIQIFLPSWSTLFTLKKETKSSDSIVTPTNSKEIADEPDFFYFAARLALMSDYSGGIYT